MKMELDKALEHEDVLEKVGVVVKTGCTMGKWCSKPQKRSAHAVTYSSFMRSPTPAK
jgi:hypothetical protein